MAEPHRVLVVDDSPTIRKVVAGVLARAGYEVGQAADGVQALAALKREPWSLALVDFVMPKLNGFELCRKLREDEALRELPVVLMSVKADRIREHFLRQTGALDALTKPFDPRALLLTVESALEKADRGRASRSASSSLPPASDPGRESEHTVAEPFSGPVSIRATVPDSFMQRMAELVTRAAPLLQPDGGLPQAIASIRRALGEEGLASLYQDVAGTVTEAVLSGDLAAIPLAEILQLLQLQRQTGILSVFNGKTEVQIALRDGFVDLATSQGAADEFRLGRYVLSLGTLQRVELDEFIAHERASGRRRRLGDALVAEGILPREDVAKALERQTSELIYDVLRWARGRFVFDHGATRDEASAAQLGLPIASIVMEGFRRVDEWRLMEGVLGDFEQVFYRDPGAIEAMGAARLSREERSVLMAIDGERSVREVIGAVSLGSFDVCKILYQLVQSRLVRRREVR